ncbi:hypothetical protein OH76DRAFT_1172777 [Lentinus brumalis]|uniref:MYND-type domain-containing protein n=1 Tax=Lentinus brumalis TaxID=2498619 RepID=A0A371CUD3_9APHY|nr:hypothetical protein OH76DRAFT_1172777 [Polyporus brumalis]
MWHNNEEEGEEEETFGQTSRASAASSTGVSTAIFEIRVEGRALGASDSSTFMNIQRSTLPMGKIIHEVVFDIPREHYEVYTHLTRLVLLKQELFYDYRTGPPHYAHLYQDTIRWIHDYPYERLKRGAELNDGPQMLEFCLRHFADCEIPWEEQTYSATDFIEMLQDLAGDYGVSLIKRPHGKRRRIKHHTPVLQQRALAACAWINFTSYFDRPYGGSLYAVLNGLPMYAAACYANLAASGDFLPTIVIRIANWLGTLKTRYPGVDIRTTPRLCELKHIWLAWDAYWERCIKRQIAECSKVHAARNVYGCDGCDIRAMHKNAFRACSGNCHPETKPHYCSRVCQEKH